MNIKHNTNWYSFSTYKSKVSIYSAVIIALVCGLDLLSIIEASRVQHKSTVAPSFNEILQPESLTLEQSEQIKELFTQYNNKVKGDLAPKSKVLVTAEQIANQTGEVTEVYTENETLRLKALFSEKSSNQRVALIEVTKIDSGEISVEQFLDRTQVYGYDMTVLGNEQIKLTKNINDILQSITLKMYKY